MNKIEKILLELEKSVVGDLLLEEERFKFNMSIPKGVIDIANIFFENGYNLFVVGGAVRDALMGEKIKDYDLATDAFPDTIERMMKSAGYRTIATGKAFGVINVFADRDEYEIATFRRDNSSSDNRHPDSVEFTTIEGDVRRRDLSVNALFYDIKKREIVDLVKGVDDLKNNRIKAVGFATERFEEDRLRILRAIRFAVRMNGELDDSINAALSANPSLEGVSKERIRDEFIKSIKSAKDTNYLINLYVKYDLFSEVLPNLNVSLFRFKSNDPVVFLATILKGNQLEYLAKALNKLTYSVSEVRQITFLIRLVNNFPDYEILKMKRMLILSQLTPTQIISFSKTNQLDMNRIKALLKFKLSVSGDQLMADGLTGESLGKEINRLEAENFRRFLGI